MSPALLVGLGNRDRGDDALGLVVLDELAARGVDARLLPWSRPEIDLLDVWTHDDDVVVVDASSGAGPPGTISRLELEELLWGTASAFAATHAIGFPSVVRIAQRLGRLPRSLEVHTVEVARTDPGAPLSDPVAAAVVRVVAELHQRHRSTATDDAAV